MYSLGVTDLSNQPQKYYYHQTQGAPTSESVRYNSKTDTALEEKKKH